VRKCSRTASGIPITRTANPLYVIDGKVIGEDAAGTPLKSLSPDQIIQIGIVCIEVGEGEQRVGRAAISVITREGVVPMMRSYLESVRRGQEEHRARTGTYAEFLSDIDLSSSHLLLPVEMRVTPTGWSASASHSGVTTVCNVTVGFEGTPGWDQPRGVVLCVQGGVVANT
jgi:hypothetical protein